MLSCGRRRVSQCTESALPRYCNVPRRLTSLVLTTRGRLNRSFAAQRPLRYLSRLLRLWLAQASCWPGASNRSSTSICEPRSGSCLSARETSAGAASRKQLRAALAGSRFLRIGHFERCSRVPARDRYCPPSWRRPVRSQDPPTRGFRFAEGDLLLAMEIRQARQLQKLLPRHLAQISLLGLWHHTRRPHIHDPHHLSPMYFETCFRVISESVQHLDIVNA